jgi:hypothetical protein
VYLEEYKIGRRLIKIQFKTSGYTEDDRRRVEDEARKQRMENKRKYAQKNRGRYNKYPRR